MKICYSGFRNQRKKALHLWVKKFKECKGEEDHKWVKWKVINSMEENGIPEAKIPPVPRKIKMGASKLFQF